ncbi:LysR substrate-binding domain-containing protein [Shewanella intestini]|uniref:LysR family transcriptional regulator n=1 Tax=Shewanella intestini TaxID=2017544 RepID=A0ABS5I448_9GAMM|nr:MULTISPECIES: LysR family transcriptional regulator [Shewanella]MBR9728809.1 LysR family transcriptional regulator [Shewanella intestini]MRG36884.1 LysR family transcriptional regulator [Shewanella sp. XMDDZSB0408]
MPSRTKQLALFLDVVQQGSFTKAAALHDMDNSLLSKQIKKLETALGVQLLNRSTRSFSLTPAGEEIFEQTQRLMGNLTQIQSIANAYQSELKGKLRISAGVHFGQQYLHPVLIKFMKTYPHVQVTLSLDDKPTDIISDHFDVAFRVGKLTESNLIARKIANSHFAVLASKDFIIQHGQPTTPQALAELPAVIYHNGHANLDTFSMTTEPHGGDFKTFKMRGNYRVGDVRTMMEAAEAGIGYCVVDLFNLTAPITQSNLVPLLTNYGLSNMGMGFYAIYPHRKPTPIVSELIDALQAHIGTPPFWVAHVPNYNEYYQ